MENPTAFSDFYNILLIKAKDFIFGANVPKAL